MLTCEQIEARARAILPLITRESYRRAAEQILPPVGPLTADESGMSADVLAEVLDASESDHLAAARAEHLRAVHWHTADWADMVVQCVAYWQLNQATRDALTTMGDIA